MDPPEQSYSGNGAPSFNRQMSRDPPEDASPSPSMKPMYLKDDDMDEYEMEGLMIASMGHHGARQSSIGAGRPKSHAKNQVSNAAVTSLAICSMMWEPRNRARSAIGVLSILLLIMIVLQKSDSTAWHKVHMSDKGAKQIPPAVYDPLDNLTPEQRHKLLTRIYGYWGFFDGSAEDRPEEPYMTVEKAGMYLDMKSEDFPDESWQVDAVYVNHFLDAATKLVRRGQDAIFATYHGHGLVNVTVEEVDGDVYGEVANVDERVAQKLDMFHLEEIDLSSVRSAQHLSDKSPKWQKQGGWTTARSMDGLERRLLHAMMTNSNFTIVVTGSWQNMGYGGNHGWQSMAGVLDHLLSGLFEKLGMNLVVRAIGLPPKTGISKEEQADILQGGRSTLEHALGWSSIYGSDVDMVVWDDYSAITNDNGEYTQGMDDTAADLFDFFARQALLSGSTHVPFIWGGDFEVLRNLHELADADVGQLGNGMSGVPETTSEDQAVTLPWASQYLNCRHELQAICQKSEHNFASQCWDHSMKTPPTSQTTQSASIPVLPTAMGWRMHQLKGYTLAYNLLAALLDTLDIWSEKTIYEGHPLSDENWHLEEYIKNIQTKVQTLTEQNSPRCYKLNEKMGLPLRMCNQRIQGRTEYTPRANLVNTSLHSIVEPSPAGLLPDYELKSVYEGVAWDNPIHEVPVHAVNALEILELGKEPKRQLQPSQYQSKKPKQRALDVVKTGDGWKIKGAFPQSDCDGSYSPKSSCGRVSTSSCLMEDHQGSRGYISGNDTTGWLSMVIPGLESGYVAVNLKIGGTNDYLEERLPDSFSFHFAIDGVLTGWEKPQFLEKLQVFNGLGLVTIMDDVKRKSTKDITISVRVAGCPEDKCRLNVSHLYWA